MKKSFLILTAVLISGSIAFQACKKDDDTNGIESLNKEQSTDAEDVSASSDNIDDEIDLVLSATTLKSSSALNLPCNITIDSSLISSKKITLTFNGDNCNATRTRTGKVEISLTSGTKWAEAGAVITVKYTGLKITHKASQRYVILNGTKTHTNVSGGLVPRLGMAGTPATIVRKIQSDNMQVTFTNQTQRNWKIARMRTFTLADGKLVITLTGVGESNGKNNLAEWGTNRNNNDFYTQINSPVIMKQECDYRPSAGEKTHYAGNRTVNVTFGTDANGIPVLQGCASHYKVSWNGIGGVKTIILPY